MLSISTSWTGSLRHDPDRCTAAELSDMILIAEGLGLLFSLNFLRGQALNLHLLSANCFIDWGGWVRSSRSIHNRLLHGLSHVIWVFGIRLLRMVQCTRWPRSAQNVFYVNLSLGFGAFRSFAQLRLWIRIDNLKIFLLHRGCRWELLLQPWHPGSRTRHFWGASQLDDFLGFERGLAVFSLESSIATAVWPETSDGQDRD